jgi:hypothetical protein
LHNRSACELIESRLPHVIYGINPDDITNIDIRELEGILDRGIRDPTIMKWQNGIIYNVKLWMVLYNLQQIRLTKNSRNFNINPTLMAFKAYHNMDHSPRVIKHIFKTFQLKLFTPSCVVQIMDLNSFEKHIGPMTEENIMKIFEPKIQTSDGILTVQSAIIIILLPAGVHIVCLYSCNGEVYVSDSNVRATFDYTIEHYNTFIIHGPYGVDKKSPAKFAPIVITYGLPADRSHYDYRDFRDQRKLRKINVEKIKRAFRDCVGTWKAHHRSAPENTSSDYRNVHSAGEEYNTVNKIWKLKRWKYKKTPSMKYL